MQLFVQSENKYRLHFLAIKRPLIMKLFIILLIAAMPVSAMSYGQSVSLSQKNVPLQKVFKQIEKQSGFLFWYENKILRNTRKVTIHVKNVSVKEALDQCFKNQPLTYALVGKTIVVKRRPDSNQADAVPIVRLPVHISGRVSDEDGKPIPGASIRVQGTNLGAITDDDGNFSLDAPEGSTLQISSLGYLTKEIKISSEMQVLNIQLQPNSSKLNQLVVVGYGKQKKSSVVAAISQVSGKDLMKTGGVPTIGQALTGKLPGVITVASTGLPGEEEPIIYIRGRSTWNDAQPLILVDGVERPLNTVNPSSVKTVTVLKDASATAIYGVRGANGVILITTKSGVAGMAKISGGVDAIVKMPSELPDVMDSYDALSLRNQAVVNELGVSPSSWSFYLPQRILNKYRNPANDEEAARYPNVDWEKALFKNQSLSYHAYVDVRGGSKSVKYYANVDYQKEGDLLREYNNNRGYQPGFSYNRLNVRSNVDFDITSSTTLKTKLFGSYGVRKMPWGFQGSDYVYWIAAYTSPPDYFLPIYPNGNFGYYAPSGGGQRNSVQALAISGVENRTTAQLTTTFEVDQDLSMLVKGLTVKGILAFDNTFLEGQRGINDLYNAPQQQYVDPWTGMITYSQAFDGNSNFDYAMGKLWSTEPGTVQNYNTFRKLYYQFQLDYKINVGTKNNFTVMGLFNRTQNATGSVIPARRENWVFRTTYNYDNRYLIEYNGSYNGSEKFSSKYRFGFFSSGGIGWNISNEKFMKSLHFVDNLKLRGSYGTIGADNAAARWLYLTQWGYGGQALLGGVVGESPPPSPYSWYYVTFVGNPNVHWATVNKANIGLDFGFLDSQISGSFDYFRDKRSDILIMGDQRAVPSYYGQKAPPVNSGKVRNQGYEFTLRLEHSFDNRLRLWATMSVTHAKNKVLFADDPALLPEYQKSEGKPIGQAYSFISKDYYNNWGELYASTPYNSYDNQKLPGGKQIVDYNADGIINDDDNVPYGFSNAPQNTYNTSVGFEWKGLSGYVQFYGVNNVSRLVVLTSLTGNDLAYNFPGGYRTINNLDAPTQMPRWNSKHSWTMDGTRYMYDGSYLRLKNVQLAYTFGKKSFFSNKLGLRTFQIYVGGDNLFLWSDMPDDREANYAGTGWASQGAYPTAKRFNCGIKVDF